MADYEESGQRAPSGALLGVLALALLAGIASLIWAYVLNGKLTAQQQALATAQLQSEKLSSELNQTEARLKATSETLGKSLGITQHELEARATELLHRQQADAARLETQQKATSQQIAGVSSEVSNVKTDVGGVKTDVAKTQSDLATAVNQMQSMRGDLGVQSGLIARTHDELEILKHKGDRNYYEFTLVKGEKQPVGSISLELRKADTKHNRYTMNVMADDKKIEKKDKGLNEPVQFYSGKDPMLYELVVNSITKNKVVGYVSSPKSPAGRS